MTHIYNKFTFQIMKTEFYLHKAYRTEDSINATNMQETEADFVNLDDEY